MKGYVGALLGVLVALVLFFGCYFGATGLVGNAYSGKLALDEQEYTEFKIALADESVSIQKLNIASSAAPVIVDFEVVTKDIFPFGKKRNELGWLIPVGVIVSLIFGAVGYALTLEEN